VSCRVVRAVNANERGRREGGGAVGAENIGDGVGWGGVGQCTQLKAAVHESSECGFRTSDS